MRVAHDDLHSNEEMVKGLRTARFSGESEEMSAEEQAQWGDTDRRLAERRERLQTAAKAAGLSNTTLKKRLGFDEMLQVAAQAVSVRAGMGHALRASLKDLNSAAHSGRWHLVLTATHAVDTPDGTTRARFETTASDLYHAAGGPMILLPKAISLFEQRSQAA
jgi:hypothetical protein